MITPVKIWRQTETGKRVPFPVLCIMCGRRVLTYEAIIDLDFASFFVEPGGCKPNAWPETVAGAEDASAPLAQADAEGEEENLDAEPEEPEI